ncbi:hypothetical protein PMI04_001425 [Sphingobium sp. AP49]|uniref:Rap1a/Tai family immunity protein n=1 Tax=Sphingobium sp. AP49 TaxID=1144307 RepID=UPI0012F6E2D1|nr:Rap1a/Tai family immunity protein [Sphingobium sp. AP49]WHO39293.1 hypothetical protein PMI04_001425 [Sphingobium sp. AP49]
MILAVAISIPLIALAQVTDVNAEPSTDLIAQCRQEQVEKRTARCSADISHIQRLFMTKFYRERLAPPFCVPEGSHPATRRDALLLEINERPRLEKLSKVMLVFEVSKRRFPCPKGNSWSPYYVMGTKALEVR